MLTWLYVLVKASYWNDPLAVAASEKVTPFSVYVTGAACAPEIDKKVSKQRNSRDGVSIRRPFESCGANRCVIVITILLMHFFLLLAWNCRPEVAEKTLSATGK